MRHSESNAPLDPDWWSSPAVPDVILPEQFAGLSRSFARSPETDLLVAVIADAVAVYAKHFVQPHAEGLPEFEEAQSWFASPNTSGPFCFLNVCSALDLEPEAVRSALSTIRAADHHAASTGRWRAVRRGGGRRHSVGPPTAASAVGASPERTQLHGDDARRCVGASSARARRRNGPA